MDIVLVTGASGLLGSALMARWRRSGRALLPVGHRIRPEAGRTVDLEAVSAVAELARWEWGAVVHCAAFRSPDFCEVESARAVRLNAEVPEELARLAAQRGARMIHISTDYVFPGTHPPYRESDPVAPVNRYGETKAEAERRVLAAHPGALVLRIPALYGNPPAPLTAPLLEEGLQAALAPAPVEVDDRIVRYPTWTDDVAAVIDFLLDRPVAGVVHVSAGEAATRYRWTLAIARRLGREGSHLVPVDRDLGRPATRPVDCRLATDRLASLGAPVPRDFSEVLPILLRERGLLLANA